MADEKSIMNERAGLPRRLLLLLTARTYRAPAFFQAAEKLGIDVVKGISMHHQLADYWRDPLALQYDDLESSVRSILDYHARFPLGAIIAVDDSGALVAATASDALGLAHNSPEAADAARDKYVMRQLLHQSGVPAPRARLLSFAGPSAADYLAQEAREVDYPCVLKPLNLNGSRGVIRADDEQQFVTAGLRLWRLLGGDVSADEAGPRFLVEQYVPGQEVAVEGLLSAGNLKILALFDKPDPLVGPFFEETIYVTPSRLPAATQEAIRRTTTQAAAALGLREGPIHAELRLNQAGPWIIELAGRSIGGLCAKTLRFGSDVSLEEMIIRQAFGLGINHLERQSEARGVMMIPIPQAGLLKGISGCQEAEAVEYIESVEITARINNRLIPLPEGDSYLGFIFAAGPAPDLVEAALRAAHERISLDIIPELPLINRDFALPSS
jgi:biotin carboxylase